ncbi:N-acetylmuramoyl-L-alanine amidase family protein, partial [Staphylococcus aureus]
ATVDGGEGIKDILYDLMSRETTAFSHLLAHSVTEALGKTGSLAREPERAAAFRVLKQAHAPSVLIELGFLSNPDEEQLMGRPQWQRQMARA